jgi:NADH:ubiquinone oxidoreductase subunit
MRPQHIVIVRFALAGQHRWCEYAGDKSFYEYDPAVVPAEWHIWLHGVTDTLPTSVRA